MADSLVCLIKNLADNSNALQTDVNRLRLRIMAKPSPAPVPPAAPLGAWGWIAIVAIFGFLAVAIAFAVYGWNSIESVSIPPMGWVVLGIGILVTLLVGGGLMALLFYSSRKHYDREAHGVQQWTEDKHDT